MKELPPEPTLFDLFNQHSEFAKNKFPESTWKSSLDGLAREIKEVEEAKSDYAVIDGKENRKALGLEYVDCFMYLVDSMSRSGFTISEFQNLFKEKLEINKNREWKKNADNSYSHKKQIMQGLNLKDYDAEDDMYSEIQINELGKDNTIYISVLHDGFGETVELDKNQIKQVIEFLQKQL